LSANYKNNSNVKKILSYERANVWKKKKEVIRKRNSISIKMKV